MLVSKIRILCMNDGGFTYMQPPPPLLQTHYMVTSNILDPPFSENLDPPLGYTSST